MLVDPPARQSGYEERLSAAQVRASRFLHVWDAGRKRQGYVLSRLADDVLMNLGEERWVEMMVESDGGFCWLLPRPPVEEEPDVDPAEEPTRAIGDLMSAGVIESISDPESELDKTIPLQSLETVATPFGKATTLVRHMRRQQVRDSTTIKSLEGKVTDLEERLEEARKREIQLRTRVARYQRRLKARESVSRE
ncbi:MAG: hypothetical protein GY913_01305 [Proteobacteria bacterium]|nr:hypothetical protein [Pseudomonadota bacterium]